MYVYRINTYTYICIREFSQFSTSLPQYRMKITSVNCFESMIGKMQLRGNHNYRHVYRINWVGSTSDCWQLAIMGIGHSQIRKNSRYTIKTFHALFYDWSHRKNVISTLECVHIEPKSGHTEDTANWKEKIRKSKTESIYFKPCDN